MGLLASERSICGLFDGLGHAATPLGQMVQGVVAKYLEFGCLGCDRLDYAAPESSGSDAQKRCHGVAARGAVVATDSRLSGVGMGGALPTAP